MSSLTSETPCASSGEFLRSFLVVGDLFTAKTFSGNTGSQIERGTTMNEGSARDRGRAALFRKLKGQSEASRMKLAAGFAEFNQPIFLDFILLITSCDWVSVHLSSTPSSIFSNQIGEKYRSSIGLAQHDCTSPVYSNVSQSLFRDISFVRLTGQKLGAH